jgi:integrase
MIEELDRRNYSESTKRVYVQTIENLGRYFKRPPDQLEPAHIRRYQVHLFRDRKLAPNTVNQRTGALRFFFITVLERSWSIADTPYPKRNFRLPKVLSQQQVGRLIESATTPFYRIILMTLYATGLRRAELAQLKVSDIDSERMVIHVKGGKGHKDREVMLSPKLLDELRLHWRNLRRKPENVAVPGQPVAHGRASHRYQSGLARLPGSGRTRGSGHRSPSAHLAPLLRDSFVGGRCGPAYDSASAGAGLVRVVHVAALRKALGDDTRPSAHIETVGFQGIASSLHGLGSQFVTHVYSRPGPLARAVHAKSRRPRRLFSANRKFSDRYRKETPPCMPLQCLAVPVQHPPGRRMRVAFISVSNLSAT